MDKRQARVVNIGDAKLFLADAREVVSGFPSCLSVDAVITDPVWPNCPSGLLPGSDGGQQRLLADVLSNVTAETVVILMGFDSDPRFLAAVPSRYPYIRSQQLPYAMPGYRGRLLGGDEVAYAFGKIPVGRGVIPGRARAVTEPKADRATGHPCPRADAHLEQIVGWWTPHSGTVIDPFMGTGSTGVACAVTGRKFIGIEIEERYFQIACERIEAAQRQGRMFS
jgi:DNA modification methylase